MGGGGGRGLRGLFYGFTRMTRQDVSYKVENKLYLFICLIVMCFDISHPVQYLHTYIIQTYMQ